MLSIWVMSWDFDRTHQPFAFDQLGPHQAEKTTAAQITCEALDRIGTGPLAKQQHRPMQPCSNSFTSLNNAARVPGDAVGKAVPSGN
jgi:hypothetical protein